jgi:hypothetical protein
MDDTYDEDGVDGYPFGEPGIPMQVLLSSSVFHIISTCVSILSIRMTRMVWTGTPSASQAHVCRYVLT